MNVHIIETRKAQNKP